MKRLTRAQRAAVSRKPRGSDELPPARPVSYEGWLIRLALHLAVDYATKDQTDVVDLGEVRDTMEDEGLLAHYDSDEEVQWLFVQVWMLGPFERRPSDLVMVLQPRMSGRTIPHPGRAPLD